MIESSRLRLTFQFRTGSKAMAKTSELVDPKAFEPETNQSALSTPKGMLRLIRRDHIKCAALNPPVMAGAPAYLSEQASPVPASH